MQVKIEKTTRDLRTDRNGGASTGVMFNGQWYSMEGDQRKLYNKTVNVEVNGKWARLIEGSGAPAASSSNGKVKFSDYERAMRIFHAIASELERDDGQARTNLVQTALVALRDGKLELPPLVPSEDDPAPFADDEEPPPQWRT